MAERMAASRFIQTLMFVTWWRAGSLPIISFWASGALVSEHLSSINYFFLCVIPYPTCWPRWYLVSW
jgi:hypothetical protein